MVSEPSPRRTGLQTDREIVQNAFRSWYCLTWKTLRFILDTIPQDWQFTTKDRFHQRKEDTRLTHRCFTFSAMSKSSHATPEFSLASARNLIRDLFRPRPFIYWTDFLLTYAAAMYCIRQVRGSSMLEPHQGFQGSFYQTVFFFVSSNPRRCPAPRAVRRPETR